MSNRLPNGQRRIYKTCRLLLDTDNVARFEQLNSDNSKTLSRVLNILLADYLTTEELKICFQKINEVSA